MRIKLFLLTQERQKRDWPQILRQKVGLQKLDAEDRVCILHFSEDVIERERTVYVCGGKVYKVLRKIPILSDHADPSIFPENIPESEPKRKKNIDYFVPLGPEILAQQRKIFQESRVYLQDGVNKINKRKKLMKRSCES